MSNTVSPPVHRFCIHGFNQPWHKNTQEKKIFTKFQKAKPEFGTWATCLHGIYILFGIISNVEVM